MNFDLPTSKDTLNIEQEHRSFNELFEQTLAGDQEGVPIIEYAIPYPKEDFLAFLVSEKDILLHGSSNRDAEIMEPRQANDASKISGNKKAVYAVTDPVLPIFYAIQDRNKIEGCVESGVTTHETGDCEYAFTLPKGSLAKKPWAQGIVYLFRKDQFRPEKNDDGEASGEWTSDKPVKPVAKLEVTSDDFRFLGMVKESEQ